jgi:glycosyltransferase involved in cell wall biosynthesis
LWRVLLPFSELQRQGVRGVEWGDRDDDRLAGLVAGFDAVVLPRLHWKREDQGRAGNWFRALNRAGIQVLYEADDDLFSEQFEWRLVQLHGYSRSQAAERAGSIRAAVGMCAGITVSSRRLETLVGSLFPGLPVRVVENYIDLVWWRRVQRRVARHPRLQGRLVVGWAGGARPEADVEDMARAWGRVAARFPEVRFLVMGHFPEVVHSAVPEGQLVHLPWMPIEQYPAGLVNVDVGCCPLSDSAFNRCKTPIKAFEYGASGAAVVGSSTVYSSVLEQGKTGYIVQGVEEWEAALVELLQDGERRRVMARAWKRRVAARHSLQKNAWKWLEAWSYLLSGAGCGKMGVAGRESGVARL